jgi:hypothetical protein
MDCIHSHKDELLRAWLRTRIISSPCLQMAVTWAQRPAPSRPTAPRRDTCGSLVLENGERYGPLRAFHCRSKHEPTLSHRAFKDGKGCHRAPSHCRTQPRCKTHVHAGTRRPAPAQIVRVQWARIADRMHRTADSLGSGRGAAERPRNDFARSTTSRCAHSPFAGCRCSTLLLLRRTPSRRRSGLLLFGLPLAFG